MNDYIKKSEAFNAIVSEMQSRGERTNFREEIVRQAIDSAPAADVRENVHGKWKHKKSWEFYVCSVCSVEVELMSGNMNFCHNCGANMRGEKQ